MKKTMTTLIAILILFGAHAGELFVKVNSTAGSYYASFDNQTHYNQNGIFRFFEVGSGVQYLVVKKQGNNQTIANLTFQIPYNQRWIGEINTFGQFQLIMTENIQYMSWYQQQNPFVQIPPVVFPAGNQNWNVLSDADYQEFMTHLKKEVFDSGLLSTAKSFAKNSRLSAAQIAGIADEFTFDDDRLEWAKYAYDYCFDTNNYYKLDKTFTFYSNRDELKEYIANK